MRRATVARQAAQTKGGGTVATRKRAAATGT
jgi:hypothetical protein